MQITLYQRTFPVKDAPVAYTFFPSVGQQRHTYTVGDKVYESKCKDVHVIVPDDAKLDEIRKLLSWGGEKGLVKSTAKEVFDLASAGGAGFRLA